MFPTDSEIYRSYSSPYASENVFLGSNRRVVHSMDQWFVPQDVDSDGPIEIFNDVIPDDKAAARNNIPRVKNEFKFMGDVGEGNFFEEEIDENPGQQNRGPPTF
jgi:hypothetical protein